MSHEYTDRTPADKDRRFRQAAEHLHKAEWAGSGNYTADDDTAPTKVTFANGRTVEIVNGHLVIGWVGRLEQPPKWQDGYNPPTLET